MLTSIAIIFLSGLILGGLFSKFKLPSILGMIIAGIIIGPYAFNIIDTSILNISADLRQIALIIILTRAGLSLDLNDLKKVGRPAVLMCFVPACIEIVGTIILAPILLKTTILEAAIIGSIIAAVSPAVIVPRMINLIDEGYGKSHSIPQLILAGASVDDVFVIVMFTVLTSLALTGNISVTSFFKIPVSILTGIILGVVMGNILIILFNKIKTSDSVKVLIILSFSFLFIEIQNHVETIIPVSGLLSVMSLGITLKHKYTSLALALSNKYNKLWIAFELFLFVLVGMTVDLKYAVSSGIQAFLLVIGALIFRMFGVAIALIKTELNIKEKLFCIISYTPKATVQAAIGAIPLTMGLSCGKLALTVAVLSILITAPFGAVCIDKLHKKLLYKN